MRATLAKEQFCEKGLFEGFLGKSGLIPPQKSGHLWRSSCDQS